MRVLACVLVLISGSCLLAQKKEAPPPRFGIECDLEAYPQDTPKATLGSILKAAENRRFNYAVAHLLDPVFIDRRVADKDGKFEEVVKAIDQKLLEDRTVLKDLRKFLHGGEVEESGESAVFKHKEIKSRQVYLKKIGNRWFFEDRTKASK